MALVWLGEIARDDHQVNIGYLLNYQLIILGPATAKFTVELAAD
jgi:hypothetical protein